MNVVIDINSAQQIIHIQHNKKKYLFLFFAWIKKRTFALLLIYGPTFIILL